MRSGKEVVLSKSAIKSGEFGRMDESFHKKIHILSADSRIKQEFMGSRLRILCGMFASVVLLAGCKDAPVDVPVVTVENVMVDNVEIYGDYVGLIQAVRRVEVHARVEGFLEKMTFEEGKLVQMNEPLFYINDDQYKARVEKAKAQLKKDQAQAAKAERDVLRLRPLYEQNAASQLDLDNAVAALDMARANVSMSEADLKQAELELSYTVVRSPLTGYISERYADIGSLVGKSNSSRLATVVKSDTVQVDFKLTALDYLRSQRRNVHLGELDTSRSWQPTVTVTLADNSVYGEKGIVDFASPQVDPQTGTFGVRAILPNPHQVLLPGQFTRVRLLLDVLENVIVIPRKAVIIEKGGAYVFVVRPDSIAEKRFVELGVEQNNRVVVDRGLSPDERIVTEGFQKLQHGQRVTWNSDDKFSDSVLNGSAKADSLAKPATDSAAAKKVEQTRKAGVNGSASRGNRSAGTKRDTADKDMQDIYKAVQPAAQKQKIEREAAEQAAKKRAEESVSQSASMQNASHHGAASDASAVEQAGEEKTSDTTKNSNR